MKFIKAVFNTWIGRLSIAVIIIVSTCIGFNFTDANFLEYFFGAAMIFIIIFALVIFVWGVYNGFSDLIKWIKTW